ncbi:mucin-5AC-like [Pecten maximus]|uniref:mucin-5AC-like n=1 Tax=Pecten maximus TaxID=6579 RepID=UPI001459189A|nr:mucin-5AC-like [Pecten maximus]
MARLRGTAAWVARYNDDQQFVQVDLKQPTRISGIVLQGNPLTAKWVTKYVVLVSDDGVNFTPYHETGSAEEMVFVGSHDQNTPVKARFDREILTNFVRIQPRKWQGGISLRFDVLSCYKTLLSTANPGLGPNGQPTAGPGLGPNGQPTAGPGFGPNGHPTAGPGLGPNGQPTAGPGVGPNGQPTAGPGVGPNGHPTAGPGLGPNGQPTAGPGFGPNGQPTAGPGLGPNGQPTAGPGFGPNGHPTAGPGLGPNGQPTAGPGVGPNGQPTAGPGLGPDGKPTAGPGFGPNGQPTAGPGLGPNGQPTAGPGFGPNGQPTAGPGLGPNGQPTAGPGLGPDGKPTAGPGFGPNGQPTAGPGLGPDGKPTAGPGFGPNGQPTAGPGLGPNGQPTAGPGVGPNGQPTAGPGLGPDGKPTAGPGFGPNGQPTAGPGLGPNGQPTAGPGLGPDGQPTAGPGLGPHGQPTAGPGLGPDGKPTAGPGFGPNGQPTAGPGLGPNGQPTAGPGVGLNGQPTAGPGLGLNGQPTAGPGLGPDGKPTAGPGVGPNGQPTAGPGLGPDGKPTAGPGFGPNGQPTAGPGLGPNGQPTAGPGVGLNGQPTAGPGLGPNGQPTAGPGLGPNGQPTAGPGLGPDGKPTAGPGFGPNGQPTAGPGLGPNGQPTAGPGVGLNGQPTAGPGLGLNGQPTAGPGLGPDGKPTAGPGVGPNGQPTAGPGLGPDGKPTAGPGFGLNGQPTAGPGLGPNGQPTAGPGVGLNGQPTAGPGLGPNGQPTAGPGLGPDGKPTAGPGVGPNGHPTAGPGLGPDGQPTAGPVVGPNGQPTAGPGLGPNGQPTAGPGVGQNGQPTAGPGLGPDGQPTAGPGLGPNGQPTAGPGLGPDGKPTAGPGLGPNGQPTAGPGLGPDGKPTAGPGLGPDGKPTAGPGLGPDGKPTTEAPCIEPMGVDNSMIIKDTQMTSSSSRDLLSGASFGRLFNEFGAWVPESGHKRDWIQVDFLTPEVITAVITQGSPTESKWVTKFIISTSQDGISYHPYSVTSTGIPKVFHGNTDGSNKVINQLDNQITARFVRIIPVEAAPGGVAMRLNFLGCFSSATPAPGKVTSKPKPTPVPITTLEPVCALPMGLENGLIVANSQISASSSKSPKNNATQGRLYTDGKGNAWIPRLSDKNPHIDVDFLEAKSITGVTVQGQGKLPLWVTSFTVSTSLDGNTYTPYKDDVNGTTAKIFPGNKNSYSQVTYLFNRKIVAQYVRITPLEYYGLPAMKFNIMGCNPSAPRATPAPLPGSQGVPTAAPSMGGGAKPTAAPGSQSHAKPTAMPLVPGQGAPTAAPHVGKFEEPSKVCLSTMGLQNHYVVSDNQLSASSSKDKDHSPSMGRIFSQTSWMPSTTDSTPWIQVDFKKPKLLSGVITMGGHLIQQWVKDYKVATSLDGKVFTPYSDTPGAAVAKVFSGNTDSMTPVRHLFNRNITTQFIRIYPLHFQGAIPALRLNILGCTPDAPVLPTPVPGATIKPTAMPLPGQNVSPTAKPSSGVTSIPTVAPNTVCDVPMGMADKQIIKDFQLSASSYLDRFHNAGRGRIFTQKDGSYGGGWIPAVNNTRQFIQVDFLSPYHIAGITTQGQQDKEFWVTKYEVYYSRDGRTFIPVTASKTDKSPMVISGNSDQNTPVTNNFPLIYARYIRLRPLEWHKGIGVRFNLLGCLSPTPAPTTMEPFIPGSTMEPFNKVTTMEPYISPSTFEPYIPGYSTAAPTSCLYWTPWISTVKPDQTGEYETIYNMKNLIRTCEMDRITKIECRAVGSHMAFNATGEIGIMCGMAYNGLVCLNSKQPSGQCQDHEIRAFCDECASHVTTTVQTPAPKVTPNPNLPVCNESKWSIWINKHVPSGDGGETENLSTAERQSLCNGGRITKVECEDMYGVSYFSSGAFSSCTPENGYVCRDEDNAPIPCDDFKARFYCDCSEPTTLVPGLGPNGKPTAGPGLGLNGQPTAGPGVGPNGHPTAGPGVGPNGQPTAGPGLGPNGQPTAGPGLGSNGQPTAGPGLGPDGKPTAGPGLGPNGQPTAGPGVGPNGQPTAGPGLGPNGQPTAGPGLGPNGQPTAGPGFGPNGQPTAGPGLGPNGQPTAGPGFGPNGQPTAGPGLGPNGQPTAGPGFGPNGQPTAGPGLGPNGQPTAGPGLGPNGQPTAGPGLGPNGQPTAGPGLGPNGQPTAGPGIEPDGTPTAAPEKCTRWSAWLNRDKPSTGSGDLEFMTPEEQHTFCGQGVIAKVECYLAAGNTPAYNSGESTTCNIKTGFSCKNVENYPFSCQDYKIKYQCNELCTFTKPTGYDRYSTTPQPGLGPNGHPTAGPGLGPDGKPTAGPGLGPNGQPTAGPGLGPDGKPTAGPGLGPDGQPTAGPGLGPNGQPTAGPGVGPNGQPTAGPGLGPNGQPTAGPGVGPNGLPTAGPGLGPDGKPTAGPGLGPNGQPTAGPGLGPDGKPTAGPGFGPNGQPTAGPGLGPDGQPTAGPGMGPNGQPTAGPGLGPDGKPTAGPGFGPNGQPTAGPGQGPNGQPTAGPGFGPNGQPTAGPGLGPDGKPTAGPGVGPNGQPTAGPGLGPDGQPTAGPGLGLNGQPTAGPGLGPDGQPTAGPGLGPNGQPTAGPGLGPDGKPTAGPGLGPNGQPTAGPGLGPDGKPTAGPGFGPNGQPTAGPGVGPNGQPTAGPGLGPDGQPTAGPGLGPNGQPTAGPGLGPNGKPTAGPGFGPNGQPTAGPGVGPNGQPTAGPGLGPDGKPTAGPGLGPNGQPTAGPGLGPDGKPTAGPGFGPNGQPTAGPGVGPNGQPTAGPGLGPNGQPTAGPGFGPNGQPTAGPGVGPNGQPTAGPGLGPDGKPTAGPGLGPNGQPTAGPGLGPDGKPTAGPGFGPNGQPTAGPGVGLNGQPTAGPGLGPNGQPTAGPGVGPNGQPTAGPGLGPDGQPTAGPGLGPNGQPTAGPGLGPDGKPTAGPGVLPNGTPTPGMTDISTPTAVITQCTQSRWSSWMNQDNPSIGDGDHEQARQSDLEDFCIGGKVAKIECYTSDEINPIPFYSTGEVVTCNLASGLTCLNAENAPIPCNDYKIRYYCECSPHVTSAVTPAKVPTTATPFFVRCGWSSWLNSYTPESRLNSGDFETISGLKLKYGLCKDIIDVQCRVHGSEAPLALAGQTGVTCDVTNGLRCYNRDQQNGQCEDYEVRVMCWNNDYCNPGMISTTPGTNIVVDSTTAVCAPGESLHACAYKCGDMCDSLSSLSDSCKNSDACVPMCKTDTFACLPGEKLKDKGTCIPESMCPCRKQDGSIAKPFETWTNPFDECSICRCFNNTVSCIQDSGCLNTTPEPSPQPGANPTFVHPACTWTYWINVDSPATGMGDIESLSSIREGHSFCDNPIQVECRVVATHTDATLSGQKLTCDLQTGLQCRNWENSNTCKDYEVRFFCPCTTPAPGLGPDGKPTAQPGIGTNGQPTAGPGLGPNGHPTAGPGLGPDGKPTAQPGIGPNGQPTAGPGLGPNGQPTAGPGLGPNGQPTAGPGFGPNGQPTAGPGLGPDGKPTAGPGAGTNGQPTAGPGLGPNGQPTAGPGLGPNGQPTAGPGLGTNGQPTAGPGLGPNGQPTAGPGLGPNGQPTAGPGLGPNGQPTAGPGFGPNGQPTAGPGLGPDGKPTAGPGAGTNGQPTAGPGLGPNGQPTAGPGLGPNGQPTAGPGLGLNGQPTAGPGLGPNGQPTAGPGLGPDGLPTAGPGLGPNGQPTAGPGLGPDGKPTAGPGLGPNGQPTAAPTCGWSPWLNTDNPTIMKPGKVMAGDFETLSSLRNSLPLCSFQMMTRIECRVATSHLPYTASGEIVTCDRIRGLRCRNELQRDKKCQDYEVRVFCDCKIIPTAGPGLGPNGQPTAGPGFGTNGQPTAGPGLGPNGHPTAGPGVGPNGHPTAGPGLGPNGQPTAGPGVGPNGQPTAGPGLGPNGQPTAGPGLGPNGQPTAGPGLGPNGHPTAGPGLGLNGQPTVGPAFCGWSVWMNGNKPNDVAELELFVDLRQQYRFCDTDEITAIECRKAGSSLSYTEAGQSGIICDFHRGGLTCINSRQGATGGRCYDYEVRVFCEPRGIDCSTLPKPSTAGPGLGPNGQPTAGPGLGPNGHPTAGPGLGPNGQPTAGPGLGPDGKPTAGPGLGPNGQPTAGPGLGPDGKPTAGPGLGPNGQPTAGPGLGPNGQPTAGPGFGPNGQPTAGPGVGPNGQPTAGPGAGPNGQPTAGPGLGPNGQPTAGPGLGPDGKPTAGPGLGPNGHPTAGPGLGPNGQPTAGPGAGPNGQPTAGPGLGPDGKPTAGPGLGPNGQPTAGPGVGLNGQPTAGPGVGPNGQPTAGPGAGLNGQPTAGPGLGPDGKPTAGPGLGPNGQPTAGPGVGLNGQPTAGPGLGPNGQPTAGPGAGPNGQPTAGPGAGPNGQPTAGPSLGPNGQPTAGPGFGPNGQPTAGPGAGPNGQPTAGPGLGPDGKPTAGPGLGPNGQPTAGPGFGPNGQPTAGPGIGPNGQPTAGPGLGPDGKPTAGPGLGPDGKPTAGPGLGPNGQPTAGPGFGPNGQPTAGPGIGTNGQPTAGPGLGPNGQPTAGPGIGTNGQPTAGPGLGPDGKPTAGPGIGPNGQPTAQPTICSETYSPWINQGNPNIDDGDHEVSALQYQKQTDFCSFGTISGIECWDVTLDAPSESSGEVIKCTVADGLVCSNAENFPIPCTDYKIRYRCDICHVQPTAGPGMGSNGQPTAGPGLGLNGQPTAGPGMGSNGQPTAGPGLGPNGQPTAGPGMGSNGNPTAGPGLGPNGQPTAGPGMGSNGQPTAGPGLGPNGQPTAGPGMGSNGQPTAGPGLGPNGQPTAGPGMGSNGQPTAGPGLGPNGQPTAGPGMGSNGKPTAGPGLGPNGQPTAGPGMGSNGQPTAGPGLGPNGQPTAGPGMGSNGQPTAGPGLGPNGQPTAGPGIGTNGQPTAGPGLGPDGKPTAGPGVGPNGQPTAQPTICSETYSPWINQGNPNIDDGDHEVSALQYQKQTDFCSFGTISGIECWDVTLDAPSESSGEVIKCTVADGLVCSNAENFPVPCTDYKIRYRCDICHVQPTAAPGVGPNGQPTAGPGIGANGQPTAGPGLGPNGQPTAGPGFGPNGQPTAGPGVGPNGQPTAGPGFGPNGQPTAGPGIGPNGHPTAGPGFGPNGQPTAGPVVGPNGQPTAQPTICSETYSPWINQGNPNIDDGDHEVSALQYQKQTDFCSFGTISGIECWDVTLDAPSESSGEVIKCTVADGLVCSNAENFPIPCTDYKIRYRCDICHVQPTAAPGVGSNGQPTAGPGLGPNGQPTAGPGFGSNGQPTAGPGFGPNGQPTAGPVVGPNGQPTAQPTICSETYSPWINQGNPNIDDGDHEVSALQYQKQTDFCSFGTISGIECWDVTLDAPSESSGEVIKCTVADGLVCSNAENFPIPCTDYKIRYRCDICHVQPTAGPGLGPNGQPTAGPGFGPNGHPTAGPGLGQNGQPTAGPGLGQNGQPTAGPGLGQNGQPTAGPGLGPNGHPTAGPGLGTNGQPTAGPGLGPNGQPTAGPGFGPNGLPTAAPGVGPNGQPTAGPVVGPNGQPTAQPTICSMTYSPWINQGNPNIDDGDHEVSALQYQKQTDFCSFGTISGIECWDVTLDAPSESSGEVIKCTVADGLVCSNAENFPIPCTDYKIRYRCDVCSAAPTTSSATSKSPIVIPAPVCENPLDNGAVIDLSNAALSSSTSQTTLTGPQHSLLTDQAWVAGTNNKLQWIRADLGQPKVIMGLLTKGHKTQPSWVKAYYIMYSLDGAHFSYYTENGQPKLIGGNFDSDSSVKQTLTPFVARYVQVIPAVWEGDIALRWQLYGCTGSPTAAPNPDGSGLPTIVPAGQTGQPSVAPIGQTGKPSAAPVSCDKRWSQWLNRDNPTSGDLEHEAMTQAEKDQFCPGGNVTKINCRTKEGIVFISAGEVATCNVDSGLTCNNADNFPIPCSDYEVQYWCDCAAAPTAQPNVGSFGSPTSAPGSQTGHPSLAPNSQTGMPTPAPVPCDKRWSQWLNRDNPTSGDMEHEAMTPAEKKQFCPGGNVTQIHCMTVDGIEFSSAGEVASCYVDSGLTCNNADNFPIPCSDYKVQYWCDCADLPTPAPSHSAVNPTAAPVTPSNNIPTACKEQMGMQNHQIRDDMITASSSRDANSAPYKARLGGPSAWTAAIDNKAQFIQVDFLQSSLITGVTTQGRPNVPSYVTSYYVRYSLDGLNWNTYREEGADKLFNGNFDSVTPLTHFFSNPIRARYIRINPQSYHGKVTMRFEIHGCFASYPTTTQSTPGKVPTPIPTKAVDENCVEYDNWVNIGQPTPLSGGDYERIDGVKAASQHCHSPMKIECRTATGVLYNETDQVVSCNLWQGLVCNNADQADSNGCFDYKVRLGCLRNSPECVPPIPHPTPSMAPVIGSTVFVDLKYNGSLCFEGINTAHCPVNGCAPGLVCDGKNCVRKSECTCLIEGKIVRPSDIMENSKCETCQCFGGQVSCLPKQCPLCMDGYTKGFNTTTCECSCVTCDANEFRCGNGQCIPASAKCDGVIDCINDEHLCAVVPLFTPPVTPTAAPPGGQGTPTVGPNYSKVTPTRAPTMHTKPATGHDLYTPTGTSACVSGWLPWYNENNRTVNGDIEPSAALYQKHTGACPGGSLERIECYSIDMNAPSYSTGEVIQCTTDVGLKCLDSDNFPVPCSNYKIRYYCQCSTAPNPTPALTATPTSDSCFTTVCQPLVRPFLQEGEVSQIVKTDDGCCDRYQAVCKPDHCSTSQVTCTTPRVMAAINPGECCLRFRCDCPATCPTPTRPTCRPGSTITMVETDCNCTSYACVPMPLTTPKPSGCRYTMEFVNATAVPNPAPYPATHQVGETWKDGLCKTCQCTLDKADGTSETVCHMQTCPDCKLGEERVNATDQCCGVCRSVGCVANGQVFKDGQSIPGAQRCYSKVCAFDVSSASYLIRETQLDCRTDNLPTCQGNQTKYDSTGCCKTCIVRATVSQTCSECSPRLMFGQPAASVGFFKVTRNSATCQNSDPIQDLTECSGYCQSRAKYTTLMRGFDNKCNCCQPQATVTRNVTLHCTDGTTFAKTYTVPTSCGCSACAGGA